MGILSFLAPHISNLYNKFNIPLGELAPGSGRVEDIESIFDASNPDWQDEGPGYYAEMAKNPWIQAAIDYRDVSRLWVTAKGIKEEDFGKDSEQQGFHPPQIIQAQENGDSKQQWEFVCWVLDKRLDTSIKVILEKIQRSYITYGFALIECLWMQEETPYGLKTILTDLRDVDPQRVILKRVWMSDGVSIIDDPYRVGDSTFIKLYLKREIWDNTNLIELPERKFALFTSKGDFGNPYGHSELKYLKNSEYGLRNVMNFWSRHLERFGSPLMVHKYPESKAGTQHSTWRENQRKALVRAKHQSVIQIHEDGQVELLEGKGETESFNRYTEVRQREISVKLCGSATALQEGKYGSFSREEATTIRQKSEKEQEDCALIGHGFNYQIIPWLVDWNWADIKSYPYMQIIEPQHITPTQPKEQEQRTEETVVVKGKKERREKETEEFYTFQNEEDLEKKSP
jgi:hypothetical protein